MRSGSTSAASFPPPLFGTAQLQAKAAGKPPIVPLMVEQTGEPNVECTGP